MATPGKKFLSMIVASAMILLSTSCSKDDDPPSGAAAHKVVFKATASPGSVIKTAVYGIDASTTTTSPNSVTWSSPEVNAPAGAINANVVVNGEGANSTSTLTVEIWVDGVKKVEKTGLTGTVLSTSAQYVF